ncbi:sulfate adenylyltransferase subunit CysD [Methanoregula formicica]|uniref:Sulfate adenylyltransferase subunit 2 n=1 Tax=Methanoregula formicica (strain DSM 22288 / NBRC 105244 / SMSP) TaxID=593750 RepID=L0HDT6_METFS|nr:sulfate adenylyltransferase subunit CysD [Methanoregula formicica]AGB01493.1 sulfate adenylyltransferase, small subunit [Methanoregula formicica SMSP]
MTNGERYTLSTIQALEAESIHIIREVAAEFENPVMLYSVGKDSSVMAHLAIKAFYPEKVPFPFLHVDTGYKFPEMYQFRDEFVRKNNLRLVVYRNDAAFNSGMNPLEFGTVRCCAELKTKALLDALAKGGYDAAFGGSRRDEEKSRAKERIFSFRDQYGQWDPKNQRPELWDIYNGKINKGESIRVFPLSNWTELDIWTYIHHETISVVPLYFAKKRRIIRRGGQIIPVYPDTKILNGEEITECICRFRTLGCHFCTGAVMSSASTLPEIIEEMMAVRHSERITRIIDHDQDSSMEQKKREGYF